MSAVGKAAKQKRNKTTTTATTTTTKPHIQTNVYRSAKTTSWLFFILLQPDNYSPPTPEMLIFFLLKFSKWHAGSLLH